MKPRFKVGNLIQVCARHEHLQALNAVEDHGATMLILDWQPVYQFPVGDLLPARPDFYKVIVRDVVEYRLASYIDLVAELMS